MSKVFDQLLRVRDYEPGFLQPKYEECCDAFLLPDMDAAVERIKKAVERGEKVLIYGDYDADGVTASAVLYDALTLAGLKAVEVMLPNRFRDGYGMSKKIVQRARETGVKLVITVDCGSRNHEIIDELNGMGVETIVTDHHECGWDSSSPRISSSEPAATPSQDTKSSSVRCSALPRTSSEMTSSQSYIGADSSSEFASSSGLSVGRPNAVAVVNPKRPDFDTSGVSATELAQLRDLAGVGVAFKLAQALVSRGMIPAGQEKWLLDLVSIGTICDSMRLRGENRRLCYYGFKVLEKTRRVGLKELITTAGVKRFDTESVGFQIGPRLNAAGRMETAEKALELLMAKQRPLAAAQALELEELNRQRKKQQQAAVREIESRGVAGGAVIVEKGDWHEGILGIVAGRLVEEYHRPAFVLAEVDGVLKGSGRSFGEFNLAEALTCCAEYTLGGGGHAEACGLRLPPDGLERFRAAVNAYYDTLGLKNQERFLDVQEDLPVHDFADLSLELLEEMRQLEPYGEGNPEPVFLLSEVRIVEAAKLGVDGKHLRLTVWDQNGKSLKLIRFNAPEEDLRVQGGETANIWVTLAENEFRGLRSVEGRIAKLAIC